MKRYLILGLAAAAVMAAGITGGVIWAHGGEGADNGRKGFAARVAEILDLEESDVKDAFKEAAGDIREDRFQARMDRRVEKGDMTQEEADAAVEWYESRPDNLGKGIDKRRRGRGDSESRFGSRSRQHERGGMGRRGSRGF